MIDYESWRSSGSLAERCGQSRLPVGTNSPLMIVYPCMVPTDSRHAERERD